MINSVEFVPLEEMSDTDWRILDYFFLRNRAKNRLSDQVVEERDLTGFFRVEVFPVHRNKPFYLWPVTAEMEDEVDSEDEETWGFFVPEPEDEEESEAALSLQETVSELRLFSRSDMIRLLSMIKLASPSRFRDKIEDLQEKARQGRSMSDFDLLFIAIMVHLYLGINRFDSYVEAMEESFLDSI